MSAYDIIAALDEVRLPKGARWVGHLFDGKNVVRILAVGLEEPDYKQVICDDPNKAAHLTAQALNELGASG